MSNRPTVRRTPGENPGKTFPSEKADRDRAHRAKVEEDDDDSHAPSANASGVVSSSGGPKKGLDASNVLHLQTANVTKHHNSGNQNAAARVAIAGAKQQGSMKGKNAPEKSNEQAIYQARIATWKRDMAACQEIIDRKGVVKGIVHENDGPFIKQMRTATSLTLYPAAQCKLHADQVQYQDPQKILYYVLQQVLSLKASRPRFDSLEEHNEEMLKLHLLLKTTVGMIIKRKPLVASNVAAGIYYFTTSKVETDGRSHWFYDVGRWGKPERYDIHPSCKIYSMVPEINDIMEPFGTVHEPRIQIKDRAGGLRRKAAQMYQKEIWENSQFLTKNFGFTWTEFNRDRSAHIYETTLTEADKYAWECAPPLLRGILRGFQSRAEKTGLLRNVSNKLNRPEHKIVDNPALKGNRFRALVNKIEKIERQKEEEMKAKKPSTWFKPISKQQTIEELESRRNKRGPMSLLARNFDSPFVMRAVLLLLAVAEEFFKLWLVDAVGFLPAAALVITYSLAETVYNADWSLCVLRLFCHLAHFLHPVFGLSLHLLWNALAEMGEVHPRYSYLGDTHYCTVYTTDMMAFPAVTLFMHVHAERVRRISECLIAETEQHQSLQCVGLDLEILILTYLGVFIGGGIFMRLLCARPRPMSAAGAVLTMPNSGASSTDDAGAAPPASSGSSETARNPNYKGKNPRPYTEKGSAPKSAKREDAEKHKKHASKVADANNRVMAGTRDMLYVTAAAAADTADGAAHRDARRDLEREKKAAAEHEAAVAAATRELEKAAFNNKYVAIGRAELGGAYDRRKVYDRDIDNYDSRGAEHIKMMLKHCGPTVDAKPDALDNQWRYVEHFNNRIFELPGREDLLVRCTVLSHKIAHAILASDARADQNANLRPAHIAVLRLSIEPYSSGADWRILAPIRWVERSVRYLAWEAAYLPRLAWHYSGLAWLTGRREEQASALELMCSGDYEVNVGLAMDVSRGINPTSIEDGLGHVAALISASRVNHSTWDQCAIDTGRFVALTRFLMTGGAWGANSSTCMGTKFVRALLLLTLAILVSVFSFPA